VINSLGAAFDPEGQAGDALFAPTSRDRNDPAYMRPLEIDPARLARGTA
jgi:hypothetical protein